MSQSVRQRARRDALERRERRRALARARHSRLDQLGARVTSILARRDELVAESERLAGEALHAMTRDLGVSMAEALTHSGAALTKFEALRLRRYVESERES